MQLIAHRGGGGLRVENTLAAFANAIELGAAGAELDVHLSRDGEVVVHHDDALNPGYCRRVGGDWIDADAVRLLSLMTYAEMQAYDIGTPRPGSDYARRLDRIRAVPDQHIPLLRDVIRLAQARSDSFRLVVEIKTPPFAVAGTPWAALLEATFAVIEAERFGERTILCSFDWRALRCAKQRRPKLATWFTTPPLSWLRDGDVPSTDIPPDRAELEAWRSGTASGAAPWFAGFDPRRFGGSCPRAVAAADGSAWFPWHRDFTAATALELARLGLAGAVWSSNLRDAAEVARLVRAGVCYLVADYPDITTPA